MTDTLRTAPSAAQTVLLAQCSIHHARNSALGLPAARGFGHGQKALELLGPVRAIADETVAMQCAFRVRR